MAIAWLAPLAVAIVVCSPMPSKAQSWPLPTIMPGGADAVFDAIGIYPGMTCEQAKARIEAEYPAGKMGDANNRRMSRLDGKSVTLEGRLLMKQRVVGKQVDEIRVECSRDDKANQVYAVTRSWESHDTSNPSLSQMKAQLEQKYGSFRTAFTSNTAPVNYVYINAYNKAGKISGPNESCGAFQKSSVEAVVTRLGNELAPAQCSYAVYAILRSEVSDPNRVRSLRITIFDYLRLSHLIEFNEALKTARRDSSQEPKGPRF